MSFAPAEKHKKHETSENILFNILHRIWVVFGKCVRDFEVAAAGGSFSGKRAKCVCDEAGKAGGRKTVGLVCAYPEKLSAPFAAVLFRAVPEIWNRGCRYDLGEVRGAAESSAQFTGFYDAMVAKGYSVMPVLLGQSRGGLMMLCWAFRNPDKVGAFAGIYPVCNIANWPLQRSKHSVLADYGMSKEEILANLDQLNPVGNLDGLAEAGRADVYYSRRFRPRSSIPR